jgi:hypothetical protein
MVGFLFVHKPTMPLFTHDRVQCAILVGSLFLLFPVVSFAQAAPFVNTLSPSFLTEKSAQLNGRVNPSGTTDTYQWFEWGIAGRSDVYETPHYSMWVGTVLVDTSVTINGLAPNTQYFYRPIAQNGHGKVVGATAYFTTNPLPNIAPAVILVETHDATNIAETSAVLNGYASPHNDNTARSWFEWGLTAAFGNQTPVNYVSSISVSTQTTITGLHRGTVYYFRAAGDGAAGRVYGKTKTFTTLGISPVSTIIPQTTEARASRIAQLNSEILALVMQLIAKLQELNILKAAP